MKDLIETIVRGLVAEPDAVEVKTVSGDAVTVYEVSVAKSDLGRVIGKQGRNAAALRTLCTAIANRQGDKIMLEIRD